jgi:hypothetical protein
MAGALERRDPGEWLGHFTPRSVPSGVIMGQPSVSPVWYRFGFTDARLSQSKALYEQNLIVLDESRCLIAMSRRLLNRTWGIAGSSGDDLGQTVRDRLANGALFPVPRKAWGGHGTGKVCSVCDVIISSTEIEMEVAGPKTLWAHLMCYDLWRHESSALREEVARASA